MRTGTIAPKIAAAAACATILAGCTETAAHMQLETADRGGTVTGTQTYTVNLADIAVLTGAAGNEIDYDGVRRETAAAFDDAAVAGFLDSLDVAQPATITLQPETDGDSVGWHATYTKTSFPDYMKVSSALAEQAEELAGTTPTAGAPIPPGAAPARAAAPGRGGIPVLALPAVTDTDGNVRATMPNPFHTPGAPGATWPPGLAAAATPTVDVVLEMPGKIHTTNTPGAVHGTTVKWNNDTLRAAATEAAVFAESAPTETRPFPTRLVALMLLAGWAAAGAILVLTRGVRG